MLLYTIELSRYIYTDCFDSLDTTMGASPIHPKRSTISSSLSRSPCALCEAMLALYMKTVPLRFVDERASTTARSGTADYVSRSTALETIVSSVLPVGLTSYM